MNKRERERESKTRWFRSVAYMAVAAYLLANEQVRNHTLRQQQSCAVEHTQTHREPVVVWRICRCVQSKHIESMRGV